MKFVGVDRTQKPGTLSDEWTQEIEKAKARLRKELTCPNCGFLMVYGVPCTPRRDPVESAREK